MRKVIMSFGCLLLVILFTNNAFTQIPLSGDNEVPAVMTSATGEISVTVDSNKVTVTGTFSGLSGKYTASHIHLGAAGSNGPVLFPLDPTIDGDSLGGTFEAEKNMFLMHADTLKNLLDSQMYVNVHTETHPPGELRGQIVFPDEFFTVILAGSKEIPHVKTMAMGHVSARLVANHILLDGNFERLSSSYTASHIHTGDGNTNGPVAIPLNATLNESQRGGIFEPIDNMFPVD